MATRDAMEELLQCMICFESYRNPKMLRCAHTFCADCLVGYQKTYDQQRRAVPGKLPCPTCRELTTLPPSGVTGLRNDFKIQKMEDLFRSMYVRQQQQQQQNSHSSNVCGPCQAQKKTVQAQSYCTNCSMGYCESCLQKHSRNALFQNHKTVKSEIGGAVSLSESLYCKKHQSERGNYFCLSCRTIVCTLCIVNEHADHQATEMTALLRQQQQDVESLTDVVRARNETLRKRLAQLEALRQANTGSSQKGEDKIKERCRQVVEAAKRRETALLSELRRQSTERQSAIDAELERIRYNITRSQAAGDFAKSAATSTSIQMMALHDELVQRMKTVADTDSAASDDDNALSIIAFEPSTTDPDLGRVELQRVDPDRLPVPRQPVAEKTATPPSGDARPPVARGNGVGPASAAGRPTSSQGPVTRRPAQLVLCINKYGDKLGELKDPLGVACLPGGEIVVSEWGNRRLQLFDANGTPLRLIAPGQIGPQGAAVTLKNNIIVSDAMQKRLEVFTASGASLSKWGLGKFFNPCAVAVSPNGNCVVSDTADHSVSVYRGEHTCVARFGSKGSRDDQFDNPLYVATGLHNEIAVSDSNNHCIKIFDSNGQFVRKIGSEGVGPGQFKFPRGLCVDQEGSVIVADRNNDRVCQLTLGGRFVRHLLTKDDGLRAPYAVAITVSGQLVVTESGNNRAAVKLFQI